MSKPVFADAKTGFFSLKTGFCRPQNRFSPTPKPVFAKPTTGFSRPENRFFPILEPDLPSNELQLSYYNAFDMRPVIGKYRLFLELPYNNMAVS